jgi:MFS family permease
VTTSVWADVVAGLRYIHHSPIMRPLLAMAFVSMAFGLPYLNLMPVFAKDIFNVGEAGLGYLLGAAGLGSLIGALIVASLGDYRRKGALAITTATGFGISLVLFAVSSGDPFYLFSYPFALVLLGMVGLVGTAYLALNNTLIQHNTPNEMLGRVMSVYVMTYALMPVGTLPLGKITDIVGAPLAIGGGGVVIVLFTIGVAMLLPLVRRLE